MSRSPADLGFGANPLQAAGRKRRGCLGAITGAVLFFIAVTLLIHPWALHIGG